MFNQHLFLLLIVWTLFRTVATNAALNFTNNEKLLCYSCKGSNCETINNEEEHIVICNKYSQLCWAGFVDQQPYRACASRYCTPNGISLDSDIRIENCCHSNLCNTLPLSWSLMSRWFRKSSSSRASSASSSAPVESSTVPSTMVTVKTSTKPQVFIVNELSDDGKSLIDSEEDNEGSRLSKLQLNASDISSFGINWDRVPYNTDFSEPVASISKFLVLLMPILLVLLF